MQFTQIRTKIFLLFVKAFFYKGGICNRNNALPLVFDYLAFLENVHFFLFLPFSYRFLFYISQKGEITEVKFSILSEPAQVNNNFKNFIAILVVFKNIFTLFRVANC